MNTVNDMSTDGQLLHRELTKDIIDSAFKVHAALGCGLLEKVYVNALIWDLELKKRRVESEKDYKVSYRDKEVGTYYADLVLDESVIVEAKSVDRIDDVHRAQLINYLKISGLRVGLLFNFSKSKLEFERLVV